MLAKGGQGGSHTTPNWNGLPGQRHVFVFKMKSLADVGLVGYVVINIGPAFLY